MLFQSCDRLVRTAIHATAHDILTSKTSYHVKRKTSNIFNPFPNDKCDSSELKVFADENFKLDENDKKFSKRVENTVGKEKLQFLLFQQCFQKTFSSDR